MISSQNGSSLSATSYRVGEFEIDPANRLLLRSGEPVPLTGKVFDVLLAFLEEPGCLLTKDELIEKVWHNAFVEEGNLARSVSTLRKALGDTGKDHKYIVTVQGRGYRFIAPVIEYTADASGSSATPPATSTPDHAATTRPIQRSWRYWALSVSLTGLLIAAVFVVSRQPVSQAAPIRSIAVLPFANAGPDNSVEYLSDGIAENLINDLSLIPEVKVKSPNAVRRYRGDQADPQGIASELGVASILTGKVSRSNDELTIDVKLIDASDNSQIWGQKFVVPSSGIMATENAIALSVIHGLRLNMTEAEQAKLTTVKTADPEAYRLYMRGRYFWNKRTGPDMKKAAEYYEQAMAIDPNYSAAYSGLANCYALYSVYDLTSPDIAFPMATKAAEKALQLDDNLADAHASLAFVFYHYNHDWAKAEEQFKRAIELNPDYATAHHWYGEMLGAEGRFDEAIAEQKIALQLDPISFIINMDLGWNFYLARRYPEAVEQYRKALELEPNSSITHHTFSETYAVEGLYADSVREYFASLEADGFSSDEIQPLKKAFEKAGFRGFVKARIAWKESVYAKRIAPQLIDTAWDYAFLNDKDNAFKWLGKSLAKGEADMVFLKFNPAYDGLHDDARFQELLAKIGLPPAD